MSYSDLELKIIRWAEARGIVKNSTPRAQAKKTLEEAGEVLEAASMMEAYIDTGSPEYRHWRGKYKDAIGDVLVTLIVGAACADVDVTECLALAHEEIKDRKGHLRPDGVFVKD